MVEKRTLSRQKAVESVGVHPEQQSVVRMDAEQRNVALESTKKQLVVPENELNAEQFPTMTVDELRRMFNEQTKSYGGAYLASLKKADIFSDPDFGNNKTPTIDLMHRIYAQRMLVGCIRPLANEFNFNSVVESATMGVIMFALSRDFRKEVTGLAPRAIEKFQDRFQASIDADKQSNDPKRVKKAERREKWFGGSRDVPFTPQSAALTQLGVTEAAYEAMREHPDHAEAIMANHKSLMDGLYKKAQRDGIDADELCQLSRVMLGAKLKVDPTYARYYSGLAHGQFEAIDYVNQKTGERKWTGNFTHVEGPVVNGGIFALRQPQSADDHISEMQQRMLADFKMYDSPDKTNTALMVYTTGLTAVMEGRRFGDLADATFDPHYQRIASMVSAMRDDGLSDQEIKVSYTTALDQTLEDIHDKHPNIENEWVDQYRSSWDHFAETHELDYDPVSAWQQAYSKTGRALYENPLSQRPQVPRAEKQPRPVEPQPRVDYEFELE